MTKKKREIDIDEEFMMCAAIRYCIGRSSIGSVAQAGYIAKTYYDKLSDDRLIFTAEDIRKEIADSLRLNSYSFGYEGSVSYGKRLPLEDFIEYISTLKDVEKELLSTTSIRVYCEEYKESSPKKYNVSKCEVNVRSYISQHDINCLLPWQRLAALFDKKHYKMLHTSFNGEERDAIAIESYVEGTEEIEDQPGYRRIVPWRYKKVYIGIDTLLSGNLTYPQYYADEYITSVEDYDATV